MVDPIFGAQYVVAGKDQRKIPVITTLTTKITEAGQTKNRIFITTETAHKAFNLLNVIHSAWRKYLPDSFKNQMFCSLEFLTYIRTPTKPSAYISQRVLESLKVYIDKESYTLRQEDLKMLDISENGKTDRFMEGELWQFSAHQIRRSLVYYLAGLELASFLELKEQLGHLSLAMTMYYGRNSNEFSEFYRSLEDERLEHQAAKMSDIYTRIRNGERIAGGKGKSMRKEMKIYGFEKGLSDRNCSIEFWKEELRSKKNVMRVHAVAPGVIYTNLACDMRIEIDMSECIDCEFDFIESAAYTEFARQAAMEKIAWMEDNEELYPDMLVKQLVTIRSAEKIMEDLGVSYDAYEPNPIFNKYLIATDSMLT